MNIDTNLHFNIFINSLFIGACMGVFYDFLRSLRISFKHNNILVSIEDIVYFTIYGYVVFTFFLSINAGAVILFPFIGFFLGEIIYFLICSKTIIFIITKTIDIIIKLICIVAKPIIFLVKKILQFFYKYLLQPIYRILYNVKVNSGIKLKNFYIKIINRHTKKKKSKRKKKRDKKFEKKLQN